MRPIYLILKISLNYSFSLFYKRVQTYNNKHPFFGSTIYVSNHPNSFMDPILIGGVNRPIVYFMTRSDVFKWWLKPILWAAHMLPIFREHDGKDTKNANQRSFNRVNRSLAKGRNILIFGEGFTDDIPIRSLKPVKKGAVRMGFQALDSIGWSKKIYICAIGVNYTDRNMMGSEVLLVNGERVCLNEYEAAYREAPNKTINEVTRLLEKAMQETVTYVKDKHWYSLHENIMQITRKGMNHENHDVSLALTDRWKYSQKLAGWINEQSTENEHLEALKKDLESYFSLLRRMKLQDRFVLSKEQPSLHNRSKELLILLFLWPLAAIGAIHGIIPYFVARKFTEKAFRRKVFWGSVKLMLGKLFGTLYNLPIIIAVTHYFFPYQWMGWVYYFIIPLLCYCTYIYAHALREYRIKGLMIKADVSGFTDRRRALAQRIAELIPVA